jgi:hypothetical protein
MDKWIVCLKHGTKYSSDYVNKLYNMCKRNSKALSGFACITEDPSGLNPDIKHISIPKYLSLQGWWYKPWVFSSELPLTGTILFLDLDIVIINNFDELWSYRPESFCIIRDFNRSTVKDWNKFNSSVFKFQKDTNNYVWDNFIKDTSIMKRMHGDQDWIYSQVKKNFSFWPDEWMQSYKWEIRNRQDVVRVDNKRIFKNVANPIIRPDTKMLVFHGDPKPSEVQDPIVVDNWK